MLDKVTERLSGNKAACSADPDFRYRFWRKPEVPHDLLRSRRTTMARHLEFRYWVAAHTLFERNESDGGATEALWNQPGTFSIAGSCRSTCSASMRRRMFRFRARRRSRTTPRIRWRRAQLADRLHDETTPERMTMLADRVRERLVEWLAKPRTDRNAQLDV